MFIMCHAIRMSDSYKSKHSLLYVITTCIHYSHIPPITRCVHIVLYGNRVLRKLDLTIQTRSFYGNHAVRNSH